MKHVRVSRCGPIWNASMEQPENRNALSTRMKVALIDTVRSFDADPTARVLILSGCDCGSFSAGGDLRRVVERLEAGKSLDLPGVPDVFAAISERRKPVIAAIDGFALGGGLELALTCDIRVATARSQLGLPEPRAGMLASYGLDRLSRMIPLGEALKIQLTGGRISAERAYQIGLVQELASDREEMFSAAERIAAEILRCAPRAVETIRRVVNVGREMPIREAVEFSRPYRERVHHSADAREGALAFLEKRPPSWATVRDPAPAGG